MKYESIYKVYEIPPLPMLAVLCFLVLSSIHVCGIEPQDILWSIQAVHILVFLVLQSLEYLVNQYLVFVFSGVTTNLFADLAHVLSHMSTRLGRNDA